VGCFVLSSLVFLLAQLTAYLNLRYAALNHSFRAGGPAFPVARFCYLKGALIQRCPLAINGPSVA